MPAYGSGSYWDERYSADEHATFEWYQTFDDLKPYIEPYLSSHPDFEVLGTQLVYCQNHMVCKSSWLAL